MALGTSDKLTPMLFQLAACFGVICCPNLTSGLVTREVLEV